MLLFAVMDSLSKFLVRDFPISETLWVRYIIFTLFALWIARARGIRRAARSTRPRMQAARGLLSVIEAVTFVLAFRYLPLADTHAVAASSPLMVTALSAVWLKERIGTDRLLPILTAFGGVMLIVRPGFSAFSWPLLVPLLGAFLWALYQVMVRFLARDDRPDTSLLWSACVGLIAVTLIAPWQFQPPDPISLMLMAGVGALGSLAHYALIRALDHAEASAVQPFGYTLLLWAALLGWLVFGDIPGPWTLLGACIVVISGLYTWTREREGPKE